MGGTWRDYLQARRQEPIDADVSPGFRRSEGSVETLLNKYIPPSL